MAAPKKNTAPKPEQVNELTAKKTRSRMAEIYKSQDKVDITISPLYRNEFSNNMPVSLNGVRINVPVDGKSYKVPKSFAMEIRRRIHAVDAKSKKQDKMAEINTNIERSPGELKLF